MGHGVGVHGSGESGDQVTTFNLFVEQFLWRGGCVVLLEEATVSEECCYHGGVCLVLGAWFMSSPQGHHSTGGLTPVFRLCPVMSGFLCAQPLAAVPSILALINQLMASLAQLGYSILQAA